MTTTKPTVANRDDVLLQAINGVGQQVQTLTTKVEAVEKRVDAIDRRVAAVEQQPPTLKTRVVQQPAQRPHTTTETQPKPSAHKVTVDQAGGDAEKYFAPMLCTKVSVSKDRKRENWRIELFLQGLRRPASLLEWQFDTLHEMVEFVRVGWPEFSVDHLDQERFVELDAEYQRLRDDKIKPPRIIYDEGIGFMVESMKTRRDVNGKTYINAVAIYPFAGQ